MTATQKALGTRPSWFTRFWAIVRYEMLWNIRKKKFIGIIILAFILASVGLALPPILSSTTGVAITENPNFAITYGATSFAFFLFALASILFNGVLGTANTNISFIIEATTLTAYLTFAWFVAVKLHLRIELVWTSEFVYSLILGNLSYWYLKRGRWRMKVV